MLGMCVVVGVVWLSLSWLVKPYDSGNPNVPRTPEQITKADEARRELDYERQRRRYWIEQIEAQHATFKEASCEMDSRGLWVEATHECVERKAM